MPELLKKRWPLLVILIVFIALKIPHLYYPHYWDESWPYASGVLHMYLNGPSLIPGAIDGHLSRGHPLMFHFLGALWCKVFGISHVSLHSFALTIAVLFLIAIYEAGLCCFGLRTAIVAVILVAFQQTFFVQSAFVLMEVLVAFLCFVSIFFYVRKKYFLTALSLTLLFYTKESGMVVGLVLGIDALFLLLRKEVSVKEKIYTIISLAIPVVLIGLFFVLQKMINGWYVLPLYSNGLEKEWMGYYNKTRESFKVLFRNDHRRYFFWFFAVMTGITGVIRKDKRYLLIIPVASCLFLIASDKYHNIMPAKIMLPLAAISVTAAVLLLIRKTGLNKQQQRFIVLNFLFVVFFTVFTSANLFYIERYMQAALIPLLFISAVFVVRMADHIHKLAFLAVIAVVLVADIRSFQTNESLGDTSIGAFDGMYVHQKIADYLVKEKAQEKTIGAEGYLERVHLTDPYTGFLDPHKPNDSFTHVRWEIDEHTDYAIFDNIEPDIRYEQVKNDRSFYRAYRIRSGNAWGEVYKRRGWFRKPDEH